MEKFRTYSVEKFFYFFEFLCYLLGVVGVACHAHKAFYTGVVQLSPCSLLQHGQTLLGSETKLGLFLCYVYLQQTRYCAVGFCSLFVNFLQQFKTVDAVN